MISLVIIATNKYKEFVQPLLDSLDEYFLTDSHLYINLFTDEIKKYSHSRRISLIRHECPPYVYPEATLYRYDIFTSIPIEFYNEYIFYIDVDMRIVAPIGREILGDIVAVRHPGYYYGEWCNGKTPKTSTAYISSDKWLKYYAGGFQGGSTPIFYKAMEQMKANIVIDEENDIMAEWHDETHWNKYLSEREDILELSPSYCMPEALYKREEWKLSEFTPKILALEKDESFRDNVQ